jgi:hypothetical protein
MTGKTWRLPFSSWYDIEIFSTVEKAVEKSGSSLLAQLIKDRVLGHRKNAGLNRHPFIVLVDLALRATEDGGKQSTRPVNSGNVNDLIDELGRHKSEGVAGNGASESVDGSTGGVVECDGANGQGNEIIEAYLAGLVLEVKVLIIDTDTDLNEANVSGTTSILVSIVDRTKYVRCGINRVGDDSTSRIVVAEDF